MGALLLHHRTLIVIDRQTPVKISACVTPKVKRAMKTAPAPPAPAYSAFASASADPPPSNADANQPARGFGVSQSVSRRKVSAVSTMKFLSAVCVLATAAIIVRGANEDELLSANVNDLCTGRPDNEYFRLTTEGDCRDVVRCDRAGVSGVIRLATVKCPNSLAFDLGLQGGGFQIKFMATK